MAQGVFPLFVAVEQTLIPIGTAFSVGRGHSCIVSAAHNIREVFKYDRRLNHLIVADDLPAVINVQEAAFFVLYTRPAGDGKIEFALWPLEGVWAAQPTDIVFGRLKRETVFPTREFPLRLSLPTIGETVWSVGYADIEPRTGLPLDDIRAGQFDWRSSYSHRLLVAEGRVQSIFTQQFSSGFVKSPCFVFDEEIEHAQSGGPVFSPVGAVLGMNSAGATTYFNAPASIASLFYPLMFIKLRIEKRVGPVNFVFSSDLDTMIRHGLIGTDGSETELAKVPNGDGTFGAAPPYDSIAASALYDDFEAFQDRRAVSTVIGPTRPNQP